VVTFSSAEELEAHIKQFNPDILLIGDDYKDKPIVGSQYAKEIVYFPRYGGLSSSKIISHG
jgi:bifunctional ADP-heptose synthase (sugar kinase/adenylyltransferase)